MGGFGGEARFGEEEVVHEEEGEEGGELLLFSWAWLVSILWIGLLRGCVERVRMSGMCVCVYVPSAQV